MMIVLKNCLANTMKTDATRFNSNCFVISCITSENKAQIEVVTLTSNGKESIAITTKSPDVDFPFVTKFCGRKKSGILLYLFDI